MMGAKTKHSYSRLPRADRTEEHIICRKYKGRIMKMVHALSLDRLLPPNVPMAVLVRVLSLSSSLL